MPKGVVTLKNATFDIRGVVQLTSRNPRVLGEFPGEVTAIPIGQKAGRLHFLHGTCDKTDQLGELVGSYRVHFSDGSQKEVELFYYVNIRNKVRSVSGLNDLREAPLAWAGTTPTGSTYVLHTLTWENPQPDIAIDSVDFISARSKAAPFLVALTCEP